PRRRVEAGAEPDLLRRELAVRAVAILRGLEEARQRAEASVPELVEDAGRGVGAVLHLVCDVFSFAHPAIGLLQPAVDGPRLLVDPAGGAADPAGISGEGVESHRFQEGPGLARDALHLSGRAVDPMDDVQPDPCAMRCIAVN